MLSLVKEPIDNEHNKWRVVSVYVLQEQQGESGSRPNWLSQLTVVRSLTADASLLCRF